MSWLCGRSILRRERRRPTPIYDCIVFDRLESPTPSGSSSAPPSPLSGQGSDGFDRQTSNMSHTSGTSPLSSCSSSMQSSRGLAPGGFARQRSSGASSRSTSANSRQSYRGLALGGLARQISNGRRGTSRSSSPSSQTSRNSFVSVTIRKTSKRLVQDIISPRRESMNKRLYPERHGLPSFSHKSSSQPCIRYFGNSSSHLVHQCNDTITDEVKLKAEVPSDRSCPGSFQGEQFAEPEVPLALPEFDRAHSR